jgi:hypothetical protein
MQRLSEYLGKARTSYEKFISHDLVKNNMELADQRFEVRRETIWLIMRLAQGWRRVSEDPDTPKPEHEKAKKEALTLYADGIKGFEAAFDVKKAEEAKHKLRKPTEPKALQKWQETDRGLRYDHLRIRTELNAARVEVAKFLKSTGAQAAEWRPRMEAAINDFKAMLREFIGDKAAIQANIDVAAAMVELGPEQDQEALDRLDEVWKQREMFLRNMYVPCRALYVKATIQSRQKRYKEALDTLDGLLEFRTKGMEKPWNPEAISDETVKKLLDELDAGEVEVRYNKAAVGEALLLAADVYGAMGKKGEDDKKPAREYKPLYAIAYNIAEGVGAARLYMDPKYTALMKLWREKSGLDVSITELVRMEQDQRSKGDYLGAARTLTEIIHRTRDNLEPDQLRANWDQVGRLYFAGKEYYKAAIVYSAIARWFREPKSLAHSYAQSAVAAISKQYEAGKDPFDQELIRRYKRAADELSPFGPAWLDIEEAKKKREAKEYDEALRVLGKIRQESPAYQYALYQIGVTHRIVLHDLLRTDPRSPKVQSTLKAMLGSYEAAVGEYEKKAPELKKQDDPDARRLLLEVTGAALGALCDAYLREYLKQPAKAIELTGGLKEKYAGIEKEPCYGTLWYHRMRAAQMLVAGGDLQQAEKWLPVIEECWKTVQGIEDFEYLQNCSIMGAGAYAVYVKGLEQQLKATADGAAKAAIEKRLKAAIDRGLAFYLELIQVAPKQSLKTYRYILYQLETRPHEPKADDLRKLVELVPKAIEVLKADPEAEADILRFRTSQAIACCKLRNWRDAVLALEQVHADQEAIFLARMAKFEKQKAQHEKNPQAVPLPAQPVRGRAHLEVRLWLARACAKTAAASKYKSAVGMLAEDLRLHKRTDPAYWETLYLLCETLRLDGSLDDAVKLTRRAALDTEGKLGEGVVKPDKDATEEKGTKEEFRKLLLRLRRDIGKLNDGALKRQLLSDADETSKLVGQ